MKFSTRTLYGLKAILVLAARYGEGSLPVSQIAKKEGISVPYLEQILNALKKKGLVKSVRGPQGGYMLSKKPSEIGLKELFYALEERAPNGGGHFKLSSEMDEAAVGSAIFCRKLLLCIDEGLDMATLKDLLEEARRARNGKPGPSPHTFHI